MCKVKLSNEASVKASLNRAYGHITIEQNTLRTHSTDFGKVKFIQRITRYVSEISQSQNLVICAHRGILSGGGMPQYIGLDPKPGDLTMARLKRR